MTLWDDIKGPYIEDNALLKSKRSPKHALVYNAKFMANVNSESPRDIPTIFGITQVKETDPVYIWIDRA